MADVIKIKRGTAAALATAVAGNALITDEIFFLTDTKCFGKATGINTYVLTPPLDSPAFTGTPTAPTAAPGTNTTQIASTAFVKAAVDALLDGAPGALDTLNELAAALGDDANFATTVTNDLALKAPLASPALTGTPTAPTAAQGTNTTQIATTAHVKAGLDLKAPLASPALTGTPTAPTPTAGDNSTKLATTAFVQAALAGDITVDGGAL